MTLYALLGRFLHWLAGPLLVTLYGPRKRRTRVLIMNQFHEVLLVRSWFGYQQWSLPGGGIRRQEPLDRAVVREALEETGIRLTRQQCHRLGQFLNGDSRARFTVECWYAQLTEPQTAQLPLNRWYEILGVGWFNLSSLPENCSPTVIRALALVKKEE